MRGRGGFSQECSDVGTRSSRGAQFGGVVNGCG